MGTEISLSSNTLFHFTDKAENLINILFEGFKPRFCLEQFTSFDLIFGPKFRKEILKDDNWEEAIPMTCFCDLPISLIASHLEFYGSYGIGLSKEWGINNGLTPITYIHDNSIQIKYLHEIASIVWKSRKDYKPQPGKVTPTTFIFELGGFFKPYAGEIWRLNRYVTKRFYDEREWRHVPLLNPNGEIEFSEDYRLSKSEFLNELKRAKANKYLGENHSLKFEMKDIKYLIIKSDDQAEAMTEAINSLETISSKEKTILITKIISSEQIKNDF
jgi:hypothetical protein